MDLENIKNEIKRIGKKYPEYLTKKLINRIDNPPCKFDYSDKKLLENTFNQIEYTFKLVQKNLKNENSNKR